MMYWIVYALFTAVETLLDIFMSWFPFYYEIKIVFILWVLSPATRGSSLLYKKVVHPLLCSREKEIDDFIEKTKQQGYSTFLNLFQSGFQYASSLFISSAMKGQFLLENQLRKSFSTTDIDGGLLNQQQKQNTDSTDGVVVTRKQTQVIYEEDNGRFCWNFDYQSSLYQFEWLLCSSLNTQFIRLLSISDLS
jgi:receptor expression-enhancing protein 1/2/3/4